eukprot:609176_1
MYVLVSLMAWVSNQFSFAFQPTRSIDLLPHLIIRYSLIFADYLTIVSMMSCRMITGVIWLGFDSQSASLLGVITRSDLADGGVGLTSYPVRTPYIQDRSLHTLNK